MIARHFSVATIVSVAFILTVANAASGECGDGTCDAGGTVASDCCQLNDTLGCETPECEALVCDFDAFCCIAEWDNYCVDEAVEFCGDLCAGGGSGGEDCANCPEDCCLTSDEIIVEMLIEVEALADSGVLNRGQDNSLTGQLERVLDAIDRGRLNVACNRLGAFTQHVFNLVGDGVMTEAEGAVLLDAADIVHDLIGCDG